MISWVNRSSYSTDDRRVSRLVLHLLVLAFLLVVRVEVLDMVLHEAPTMEDRSLPMQ